MLTLGLGLDWVGEFLDLVSTASGIENEFMSDIKYLFFNAGAFLIVCGAIFWVRRLTATIDRLSFETVVDPLTRAYNRRYLARHFQATVRASAQKDGLGKDIGIAIIDLDDFKNINDRYGHVYGDIILKKVVAALQANLRRDDVVVRYGGDEFLVVVRDVTPDDMPAVEERIRKALCSIILPRGEKLSASVGFAFAPADGIHFEQLMAVADQRMYAAKKGVAKTAGNLS